ncbi:MAG: hypothetical protein K0R39_3897 [Symbiobacteriaceae bacterium]|jgi:uncharacterized protein (DUF58 family)|nr:hypothetical protein [Symbiobacteriaceae bacterium]
MKSGSTKSSFAPTPRLAGLLVAAALPSVWAPTAWVSQAALAILATAAVADLLASRRRIEAVRKPGPVLSIGAENPITVELQNLSSTPVDLELKDDLPLHMAAPGEWPKLTAAPGKWATVQYRVKPMRRGQYVLGPLHGRYLSKLGLWSRRITWPITETARVYPNLKAARQWELAIQQGRHLEGLKRARLRGQGTEFESLREYQEGDQYKAINWAATARTGKLTTTLYQIDRSQPVMLLIDAGRLMTPYVNGLAKLDHALNAALLLATVAAERDDHCGLMLFGGEVKAFMPPRKGRGQVLAMMEALYNVAPEQVEPDYGRMLGWFRAKHKKRSLVVFFTDMIDPHISKGLIEHLSALASHHVVLLVCMADPALLALSQLSPSDSKAVYQKVAALEVLAQRAETKARLQAKGVLVIDVPPEEFSTAVVNHYLLIKEQGRL